MNDPHLALQRKFEEHFATVDATAQIVLKGHLLIEEALDTILGKFVFHPEYLEGANLRFTQKIDLARSVSLDDHNNEMWELVKAINSLRNELSHSLKSIKREQKTQRVIDLYLRLLDNSEMAARHKNEQEEVVLMWATSFFIGFLSAFEREVDRFKSLVNALDHAANPHRHSKVPTPKSDG
jgi:hypothetical protein